MHTTTSNVVIPTKADKVWNALVKPEFVKQWQYGSDLLTDWRPGNPIRFRTEWQGQVFEQWGTVISVEPFFKIKYSLFAPRPDLADSPENYFFMTYLLDEKDGNTTLTIVQDDPRPRVEAPSDEDNEENPILSELKRVVASM